MRTAGLRRSLRRAGTLVAAACLALGGVQGMASAAVTPKLVPAACHKAAPGHAACQAIRITGARPDAAPSPTQLQRAYGVAGMTGGQTVYIVDAFDDPNAESDLGTFRSQNDLSPCTTQNGCFKKIDQRGGSDFPSGDTGWGLEISLDLDAVSSVCPGCHMVLVEADDSQDSNLGAAVNEAVSLGAKFVSNSYSESETGLTSGLESDYDHPGVVVAAATGDSGSMSGPDTQFPASSPTVVAVGGTTLNAASNTRGFTESTWDGAGSGCSSTFAKPSYQQGVTTACNNRATSDVSADADPASGINVFDTFGEGGFEQVGGTSLATPLVSAIWALAGAPNAGDNPVSYPYSHAGGFNDVTSGSNGGCGTVICDAGPGWDGPTGLGTPAGVGGLQPPGSGNPPGQLTVNSPGNQSNTVGDAVNLQMNATGGTGPFTWSASRLPAGLSIGSGSGVISGSPTTAGTSTVTVTAKDSTGQSASTDFTWTVNPPGGGGGSLSARFALDDDFGTVQLTHFTVTNNGSSSVAGYTLKFTVSTNESAFFASPGTLTQVGSTTYTIAVDQSLRPGESQSVFTDFQVDSGSFHAPTGITVS